MGGREHQEVGQGKKWDRRKEWGRNRVEEKRKWGKGESREDGKDNKVRGLECAGGQKRKR